MKCIILFVLYLFSLFSSVYSLGLNITSLVGNTAVVQWTREEFDPDPLAFDLRFVIPPYYDVGLAVANVYPREIESYGNVTVQFPQDGRCMLVAVSGSRNFQIGQTAVVEVAGNTTVPTPSPTTSPTSQTPVQTPTPSSTASLSPSELSTDAKKKPNVLAIVSGVLGGVLLSAILIFVVLYFHRRRPHEDNRISFHGERMVKSNPSIRTAQREGGIIIPYPFSSPRQSFGSNQQSNRSTQQSNPESIPQDVERGLAVPPPAMTSLLPNPSESIQSPLASAHIVPPPRGPRDRSKSVRHLQSARTPRTNGEPTARQQKLAEKLAEVEKQIEELKSETKPRPSTVVLLDDLEMKKTWLVKQRDTLWAQEEIDTLPPGYSRYMT